MTSTGFSDVTGKVLGGFDHVRQSIGIILSTPIGSRVMRREFGSELYALIDRPMNDRVILAMYSAVATALALWEPRFRLRLCSVETAAADGCLTLRMVGTYMPNGHLGDFTPADDNVSVIIPIARAA